MTSSNEEKDFHSKGKVSLNREHSQEKKSPITLKSFLLNTKKGKINKTAFNSSEEFSKRVKTLEKGQAFFDLKELGV